MTLAAASMPGDAMRRGLEAGTGVQNAGAVRITLPPWRLPAGFATECRKLAAAVQDLRGNQPSAVVAITSPQPGVGVSTIARCLARQLAHSNDESILLLDAAPGSSPPAFGDAARFRATWAAAATTGPVAGVAQTSDERLSLLAIGSRGEDVAAEHVTRVTAALRSSFGFVIVDCPPVLDEPVPSAILQGCDGAVLVLDAGTLSLVHAQRSAAIVRAATRPLGLVVNRRAG